MAYLFSECSSLISLPDISNWNINNVKIMGGLFYSCSSLKSLPDISNWKLIMLQQCMVYFMDVCH